MKRILIILGCCQSLVSAALVEAPLEYEHEGVKLEGFHVYDDEVKGKRPAILVVHQWTGLSDHEKEQSRKLAELGYNVLAADVYGKGVRPKPPEAGKEASKYRANRKLLRARLAAGLEALKQDPRTDRAKVGAIGYCFGGMGVLELVRAGANLQAVVSLHGSLDAASGMEARGPVKTEILVLHGAADPHAPAAQVEALKRELTAAGAPFQITLYPGAVHAFTQQSAGNDPSKGAAYQQAADEASWQAMKGFFERLFGNHP
jgi:dienelactone hydrolase